MKAIISKINLLLLIVLQCLILMFSSCERFPPSDLEIGHIDTGTAYDLCIDGDYAYCTCNQGMAIIDINDPNSPKKIDMIETDEAAFGVLVENNIAFLGSAGNNNLKIIDVTNKSEPVILSELTIPGSIYSMSINDSVLFLSTWEGRLYITDVSDLRTPEIISNINCDGSGTNLAFYDKVIYYANSRKGLQTIDITDLTVPLITAVAPNSALAWVIVIKDEFLYLGQHNKGFTIYNIEDDFSLTDLSSKDEGGEVYGISQEGDKLYVADLQDGVEVWDISNKTQPTIMLTVDEYTPHKIFVKDAYIYIADQDRSFCILDTQHHPFK